MEKVYIIGIGPGSIEYLTYRAHRTICDADVLVGVERLLSLFVSTFDEEKRTISLKGNYSKVLEYILNNREREKIAVLVTGDPGLFSFSTLITERLHPDDYEIIPGISSLQLAFARIGEPWQDVCILSLHGRTRAGVFDAVINNERVFLLTDKTNSPSSIAIYLYKKGVKERKVIVFENLSLSNERIIHTDIITLKECKEEMKNLCVMLIQK